MEQEKMYNLMILFAMLSHSFDNSQFTPSTLDQIKGLVDPRAYTALEKWITTSDYSAHWSTMNSAVQAFVESTGAGWGGPNCPMQVSEMIPWLKPEN